MKNARAVRRHRNHPAGMAGTPMRGLLGTGFRQVNAVKLAGKDVVICRQQDVPQPLQLRRQCSASGIASGANNDDGAVRQGAGRRQRLTRVIGEKKQHPGVECAGRPC